MTAAEALNHRWLGRTSSVSTKNLFAKEGQQDAKEVKSPIGSRPGSATSQTDESPAGMKVHMVQYNIDRKVAMPSKLIKAFDLPQGSERVGKYSCSLGNTFGQLHVTTTHICFLGSFGKKVCVPLKEVSELKPTKRFPISPGNGHSLHIKTGSQTLHLNGISERDDCLKLVVSTCGAVGATPIVTKS